MDTLPPFKDTSLPHLTCPKNNHTFVIFLSQAVILTSPKSDLQCWGFKCVKQLVNNLSQLKKKDHIYRSTEKAKIRILNGHQLKTFALNDPKLLLQCSNPEKFPICFHGKDTFHLVAWL